MKGQVVSMKVSDILEKWEHEASINGEKIGMFNGKTKEQLEAELNALKKAGPHPISSPGHAKIKELEFALKSKNWNNVK